MSQVQTDLNLLATDDGKKEKVVCLSRENGYKDTVLNRIFRFPGHYSPMSPVSANLSRTLKYPSRVLYTPTLAMQAEKPEVRLN